MMNLLNVATQNKQNTSLKIIRGSISKTKSWVAIYEIKKYINVRILIHMYHLIGLSVILFHLEIVYLKNKLV